MVKVSLVNQRRTKIQPTKYNMNMFCWEIINPEVIETTPCREICMPTVTAITVMM